ncbi:SDR family NAD(P)-dependent oxidoreductase [Nocardioides islandensis]|uniref:SDR family NAD(P)-dependent oxidoreductase n=1 Tax=Nocardioides islandensis TaxID=433663 RepID=A0A930VBD1_9ACTN|nr:SDR family NAD(P)-dependent oxidoreductase [Nocardioides islandensis]MBF4763412.1 SDR family NAD(P)-dependent oxidoreductase [Nocardioides islandensis]
MSRPVVIVVAAGPGVSGSLARRYAREGYDTGLVGVDETVLTTLAGELEDLGATAHHVVADITDADAATEAIGGLAERFGRVDVLHFNPSAFRQKHPLTLTSAELLQDVGLGVAALLTALQAVRPYMSAGGRVTATGSMAADEPWNEAASLGVQKAGLRNLVHSIDATLEPDGIRAASVTVRGTLGKEGPFTPDRVADALWDAAHQDEAEWRTEVPYSG